MHTTIPGLALASVTTILAVCAATIALSSPPAPGEGPVEADAGPGCVAAADGSQTCPNDEPVSVLGAPLASCSTDPMTGFFRDGSCRTGPSDRGVHVVCATMTDEFLAYTRAQGNDLSSPSASHGFPGLEPGDRWCLCAARWDEAREAGVAPAVVLEATETAAASVVSVEALQAHATAGR